MKTTEENSVVTEQDNIDNAVVQQSLRLAKNQADNVDMFTQTKLMQAREQAVAHVASLELNGQVGQSGQSLHWYAGLMPYLRQPKALLLALVLVLLTLISVQQYSHQQKIENSDALLLAADLPPEAFADKGFNQWVEFAAR